MISKNEAHSEPANERLEMERLSLNDQTPYNPIELAIHVARYLPIRNLVQGRRVLDAGCGTGYTAHIMREWGAKEVVGVDISQVAIREARQRFASEHVHFVISDLATFLSERRKAFEVITCVETIEHVADTVKVLQGLRLASRMDSYIYITCPNDIWYYGVGPSLNPHHRRVMSFSQFASLSKRYLGPATSWLVGSTIAGFSTIPLQRISTQAQTWARAIDELDSLPLNGVVLRGKGGQTSLTPGTSLYYAGLWAGGSVPKPKLDATCAIWPVSSDYRMPAISSVPKHARTEAAKPIMIVCDASEPQAVCDAQQLGRALGKRLRLEIVDLSSQAARVTLTDVIFGSNYLQVHCLGAEAARALIGANSMIREIFETNTMGMEKFLRIWSRPIMTFSVYQGRIPGADFWNLYSPFFDAYTASRSLDSQLPKSRARRHAIGPAPSGYGENGAWIRSWLRMWRNAELTAEAGVRDARAALFRAILQKNERAGLEQPNRIRLMGVCG